MIFYMETGKLRHSYFQRLSKSADKDGFSDSLRQNFLEVGPVIPSSVFLPSVLTEGL